MLTVVQFVVTLEEWTSRRAPASTVSPTTTCSTPFGITWRAFETDDDAVTMFIGPSTSAEPLEVGVVTDDDGTAVIHAMRARPKFLKRLGKQ